MRNGNERKSSPLDCDVGLGLKMPAESYTCGYGGGPLFSYTSNRVSDCAGSDVYHQTANYNTVVLPRSFQNTAFRVPGGGGGMSGKALFTESQWQELERQNTIHKYLLASIPVPHQLLLPSSSSSSTAQCNIGSGLELRFGTSGASDPEPWRCKRTDGKKWRCSRDVAPDQKYCERHAHKAKSRSRKHVEITPHLHPPPPPPPNNNNNNNRSTSQISPSMLSATSSYDQTSRSIEWFMRGGGSSSTTSSSKQPQWQQQITKMPSPDSNKTKLYEDYYYEEEENEEEDKQGFYVPDTSNLHKHHKMDTTTQTTRHFFIDSWEKDIGFDVGLSAKDKKKFPPSSLSLSMSGGGNNNNNYYNNNDEDDANKGGGGGGVSWMNIITEAAAAPGGPLGEALCLGNNATWNLASPARGGYNSNNTNSSGCSCEDGTHALNFIG